MGAHSSIEWTEATWNPVLGCTKVSPGCKNCYAERMAERFRGTEGHVFENGFDLRLAPHILTTPLHWAKPRKVFVNSMSDLFHEQIDDEYILEIARIMCTANWHTYQILTKRSERMRDLLNTKLHTAARQPFIHWGVSVEDRKYGVPRIKHLQESDIRIRFLSIEPLLEHLGQLNLRKIHQVIVGGESGPGARPMEEEWVQDIRRQCKKQRVPFFFKQWGGVRKCETGRELNGRTYEEMPKVVDGRIALPILSNVERLATARKVEDELATREFALLSRCRKR